MAQKHEVKDVDKHFIVDANTREIIKQTGEKSYLMQYDHNSEEFTFEVPIKIESHDMSKCDLIEVHYLNTASGTSVSTRKTYRGIYEISKDKITVGEDAITFGWLIPENATMYAGVLKFQLRFICYDDAETNTEGYKWHTDVNEDISIKAGLGYSEGDMTPATTATLQSLKIYETDYGVDIVLDGEHHKVYNGGLGETLLDTAEFQKNKVTAVDGASTDSQYPSAKAVHDAIDSTCIHNEVTGVGALRVDDVSPFRHRVNTKVRGKNLANPNKFVGIGTSSVLTIADDIITIAANASAYGMKISNEHVGLEVGKTYTLSCIYNGTYGATYGWRFYYADGEYSIPTGTEVATISLTKEVVSVMFYIGSPHNLQEDATISSIQIEEGNAATEYTPYVDPSTMTVTRYGKNLFQPKNNSGSGYTATVNSDGSVTVTGAANTTNSIYLTLATHSADQPLVLNSGTKYRVQSWSDNNKSILMKLVKNDGGYAWTSPTQFNDTSGEGYQSIVQVYVESTGHQEGDTSLRGNYRFMLEVGESTTEFEPYKEPLTYSPESDGTVNGIIAVSPTMTLLVDEPETTIEAEYGQDMSAVIDAFNDCLDALLNGGA